MEVFISQIPSLTTEIELHDYVKNILHSPTFQLLWRRGFPMNFKLHLHANHKQRGNTRNARTATLLVPDRNIGQLLLTRGNPPLRGRSLLWKLSRNAPNPGEIGMLDQTPYLAPDQLREREQLENALSSSPVLRGLQFGWLDRDEIFSIEWERLYTEQNMKAHINFVSDKREMRIVEEENGADLMSDGGLQRLFFGRSSNRRERPRMVTTSFSNVETMSRSDRSFPEASIIFTFYSSPSFEEARIDLLGHILGIESDGPEIKRTRKSSMDDPEHARVSPFTSLALRVIFESRRGLEEVMRMAAIVKFPSPLTFPGSPVRRSHFSRSHLEWVEAWIATLPWKVAYHTTSLLRNLLLSAAELRAFQPRISQLVTDLEESQAAEVVRTFALYLPEVSRVSRSSSAQQIKRKLLECFNRAKNDAENKGSRRRVSVDTILCYHVTVTPTTFMLHGPDLEQSNRVLREYIDYQDCFIRVNFTDEEKLQYRWNREVDGQSFVHDRVGGILKAPFNIAGRMFSFLAYSNSALKEHAVWFVKPFQHPTQGLVTAESIRKGLGNFDKVIRCPARFGARMSQAFSATDKSITITAEEIHPIDDIRNDAGVNFTDGVGTISRGVADDIVAALESSRQRKRRRNMGVSHSAFQVRLGGIKGMLSVDYRMSEDDATICVRPSMIKFDAPHSLDVEIAGTFERPKPMYLNRPLIMILETLGVSISVFETLQQNVINSVKNAVRSSAPAAALLDQYGLGTAFRISSVLQSLQKLGLSRLPRDEFVNRGLSYAVNDVLRSLKHKARIIVPDSYTLVGVADVHGYLREGEIFACIRDPHQEPFYLEGDILITRSPAIHPGDVQMVRAIGPPPINSPFANEKLPNCVVFATKGRRSLPQSLGGGDLDGDLYNLIAFPDLFPERTVTPASYPETKLKYLPEGQRCTIEDVADFVCDFLNNDHLGMIANQNLIIADQSQGMSEDPKCLILARLASEAVDFAKSGVPANISNMPKLHFARKPDWSAGEILRNSTGDFYPSKHALGVLYRAIELPDTTPSRRTIGSDDEDIVAALRELRLGSYFDDAIPQDEISVLLRGELEPYITLTLTADIADNEIFPQFASFVFELQCICANHSLTRRPLTEEECWAGTIVAKSSQPRQRNELQARMRQQCKELVDATREELSDTDVVNGLLRAWVAWKVSCALGNTFGAKTYGFVALGSIFEALKELDEYH